jgi:drug/metabolite transporter (DMT)-like permease
VGDRRPAVKKAGNLPGVSGPLFGLLAALSFGLGAPLAKLLGGQVAPLMLAALLYGGAAAALWMFGRAVRRPGAAREAPLVRGDAPALVAITVLGGMVGPLLMLVGLARVSATAGALLLNFEGPLTALIAVVAFGEHLGRRALLATALVAAGAVLLAGGRGVGGASVGGAAALAAACLAWAIDNNLTQRLALRDPVAIVRWKTLGAAGGNLVLALAHRDRFPAGGVLAAALGLGAVSYGASVLLDAYALRVLGAAREAAFFATAPFIGAVVGAALFREPLTAVELGAGLLMLAGVMALLRERHGHEHTHEPLEHEHAHVHDAHHRHAHAGPVSEPHSHWHRHEPLTHAHPHVPDAHHRHRH